jgi:hypothetical protein
VSPDPSSHTTARHLADLAAAVAQWTDLPAAKRGQIQSGIRTVGLAAHVALARRRGERGVPNRRHIDLRTILCNPPWLNDVIFEVEPAALGLENPGSYANAVSQVRYAMRRAGLLDDKLPELPEHGCAWRSIVTKHGDVDDPALRGLSCFARWAYRENIVPVDVTDDTLVSFEAFLVSSTLRDDIPGYIRTVAKDWNHVRETLAEGQVETRVEPPPKKIKAPPRQVVRTVPITSGTVSFQENVAGFESFMCGTRRSGPFRGKGAPRPLRPATVKSRIYRVRQAFTGLIRQGRSIETINGLADLVTPEAFESILLYYWRRAVYAAVSEGRFASPDDVPYEIGVTSTTGGVAKTLLYVAKTYLKVPAACLEQLKALAVDVTPPRQTAITAKNLAGVRQLDDPHKRLLLVNLPHKLMKLANELADKETATTTAGARRRRARIARNAVAIQFQLHLPVRNKNFVSLEFGRHLPHDGNSSGRITHLSIPADEMKNTAPYDISVAPALDAMLQAYRLRHHPIFAPQGSPFVFPSDRPGKAHIGMLTMYNQVKRTIEREVGIVLNLNLFRHLSVRFTLEDDSGALEDARQLLGDKGMGVVLGHYSSLEPATAAKRHAERLERARKGSRPKPKPKSKPKPRGRRRKT